MKRFSLAIIPLLLSAALACFALAIYHLDCSEAVKWFDAGCLMLTALAITPALLSLGEL